MVKLSEAAVTAGWLSRAAEPGMITEEDGPVTVVYPGRRNDDHGPDFRDALVATCHGLQAGDIEIHTESSGWWAHHHHTDAAYNRVILHVVFHHDAQRPAVTAAGRTIPTLCLEKFMPQDAVSQPPPFYPDMSPVLPCRKAGNRYGDAVLAGILTEMGRQRFLCKEAAFRQLMEGEAPSNIIYRGIIEALGYTRNREPMRRLADAVPVSQASIGVLLGAAGLLPSQRSLREAGQEDPFIEHIEAEWQRSGLAPELAEGDWHCSRVRPANFPVRRIAAMAALLERFNRGALWKEIAGLAEGCPTGRYQKELEKAFMVPALEFWEEYLDFGLPAQGKAPALCGRGRAADIIINIVLPAMSAWYRRNGCEPEAAGILDTWVGWPGRGDYAGTERLRENLGLTTGRLLPSVQQQGLLHIRATWCSRGACRQCPLSVRGSS